MPLGYSTVTMEKIVGTSKDNEKIELDFIGGNGEKTLGNSMVSFYGARLTSKLLETERHPWIPFLRWTQPMMIVITLRNLPQHHLR